MGMSLKDRFELTASSMTKMLHSLKSHVQAFPVYRGFPHAQVYDNFSTVSTSPKSGRTRKLSINATEFSPSAYGSSINSSSDTDVKVEVLSSSSDSERYLVHRPTGSKPKRYNNRARKKPRPRYRKRRQRHK